MLHSAHKFPLWTRATLPVFDVFSELKFPFVEELINEEHNEHKEHMKSEYESENTTNQQQCEYDTEHKVTPYNIQEYCCVQRRLHTYRSQCVYRCRYTYCRIWQNTSLPRINLLR